MPLTSIMVSESANGLTMAMLSAHLVHIHSTQIQISIAFVVLCISCTLGAMISGYVSMFMVVYFNFKAD